MCLQNAKDAILKHPDAFCLHKTKARVILVVLTRNDLIDTIGGEETWPLLNSLIIENLHIVRIEGMNSGKLILCIDVTG